MAAAPMEGSAVDVDAYAVESQGRAAMAIILLLFFVRMKAKVFVIIGLLSMLSR